jgi:O-antigen biosynthesis protein
VSTTRLVSVITPCYNAAEFIDETIRSVAAQSYPRIEHVVVDDASTDRSWDRIRTHGDRVRALRLDRNGGGSHARNRGAAMAGGDFLMFLDADDLIAPGTIESLVGAAAREPESVAYCAWRRLRLEKGEWVVAPAEIALPDPDADPLRGWLERGWVPPCAVLWPRSVYETTGGWDEAITLNDDGDLMMRALVRGAGLVRAEGGEALYRAHGDTRLTVSATTFTDARLRSALRVIEKIEDELRDSGRFEVYASAVGTAYHRLALAAFQQSQHDLARECRVRGERYGGNPVASRTAGGRLLTRLLGAERKERLVLWLARLGIATPHRRRALRLRAAHDRDAARTDDRAVAVPTIPDPR